MAVGSILLEALPQEILINPFLLFFLGGGDIIRLEQVEDQSDSKYLIKYFVLLSLDLQIIFYFPFFILGISCEDPNIYQMLVNYNQSTPVADNHCIL